MIEASAKSQILDQCFSILYLIWLIGHDLDSRCPGLFDRCHGKGPVTADTPDTQQKSHSKASGGTGLGLSIVKHAVQYHHGKVTMHSVPGEGTTIRVLFPCKPLSAPEKG